MNKTKQSSLNCAAPVAMRCALTREMLSDALEYDPETGDFRRRIKTCNTVEIGEIAGTTRANGYKAIWVCGTLYYSHRLAVLYMTGEWPEHCVDHINGDRGDNRWSNLRTVSHRVNSQNQRRARKDNISGLIGAKKMRNRWCSTIRVGGKSKYLGSFDTPQEAHEAYISAKRLLHDGCTI